MIAAEKGFESCSGCGCCQLSCPTWRRTKDTSLTPHGRFKALQWGASLEEVAESIDECLLCGACEPLCPEGNDITGITLDQRRSLNRERKSRSSWYPGSAPVRPNRNRGTMHKPVIFLPGEFLSDKDNICSAIIELLGGEKVAAVALYDGREISASLEAGLPVSEEKIEKFVMPLRGSKRLVVSEGGFIRHLRKWLPKTEVITLGEALLSSRKIRDNLSADDLYIVESRGYHHDYSRLVRFYDRIINETGIRTNLDLNRTAIPTGASSLQGRRDKKQAGCIDQAGWILRNKDVKRIIVEDMADMELLKGLTNINTNNP